MQPPFSNAERGLAVPVSTKLEKGFPVPVTTELEKGFPVPVSTELEKGISCFNGVGYTNKVLGLTPESVRGGYHGVKRLGFVSYSKRCEDLHQKV
jgi:hypothetical protein